MKPTGRDQVLIYTSTCCDLYNCSCIWSLTHLNPSLNIPSQLPWFLWKQGPCSIWRPALGLVSTTCCQEGPCVPYLLFSPPQRLHPALVIVLSGSQLLPAWPTHHPLSAVQLLLGKHTDLCRCCPLTSSQGAVGLITNAREAAGQERTSSVYRYLGGEAAPYFSAEAMPPKVQRLGGGQLWNSHLERERRVSQGEDVISRNWKGLPCGREGRAGFRWRHVRPPLASKSFRLYGREQPCWEEE